MYATLSLLHLKFDKLLMMRVRIASINSYVYTETLLKHLSLHYVCVCFVKTITDLQKQNFFQTHSVLVLFCTPLLLQ